MAVLGVDTQGSEAQGVDAREYLRILSRRRWTIVATTLVCALLALGYALLAPKSYTASATVLVKHVTTDLANQGSGPTRPIDLATEQSIASSDLVAEQVRARLQLDTSVQALQNALAVTTGTGDAATLRFAFRASTPERAGQGASAFAQVYLERRQAGAQEALDRARATLQDQIEQVESQLSVEQLGSQARGAQTPAESIAVNQSIALRGELNRLSLASVDAGNIINQPLPADRLPRTPSLLLLLSSGLLLGLLLGLVLAYLHDRLSDRVYLSPSTTDELRPAVLETLPMTRRALRQQARDGTLVVGDGSAAAAAYGRASERVRAMLPSGPALVVVTSVDDDQASGVTAANLAAAWAQTGTTVTLLTRQDAVLRSVTGVGSASTFADLVDGLVAPTEVGARATALPELVVVPIGQVSDDLLRTNRALDAVRRLSDLAEVVIVDTASVLHDAAGLAVAARADLVLVAVVDRVTPRPDLALTAQRLEAVGPALVRTLVLTPLGAGGSEQKRRRATPLRPTRSSAPVEAPSAVSGARP